jgi:hypothetical protein
MSHSGNLYHAFQSEFSMLEQVPVRLDFSSLRSQWQHHTLHPVIAGEEPSAVDNAVLNTLKEGVDGVGSVVEYFSETRSI